MIIFGSKNKHYGHAQNSCLLCQALHIINLWCVICPKGFIMSPPQLPFSAAPQLKAGFVDRFIMHKAWPKSRPAIYYRHRTQTSPTIRKWCLIDHKMQFEGKIMKKTPLGLISCNLCNCCMTSNGLHQLLTYHTHAHLLWPPRKKKYKNS